MLFALFACNTNNNPTDNTSPETETPETEENTVSNEEQKEERPYDKYGILYEEEISYCLSDYGLVYWHPTQEFYVLTPRGTFRQVILGLAKDSFNETYLEYWDFVTEVIRFVSREYPSAICVANPANSNSYLSVIVMGDIGYLEF